MFSARSRSRTAARSPFEREEPGRYQQKACESGEEHADAMATNELSDQVTGRFCGTRENGETGKDSVADLSESASTEA